MAPEERKMLMQMPAVHELLREAVAEEREACARLADCEAASYLGNDDEDSTLNSAHLWHELTRLAAAIRRRT